jgi:hypothetical protein
MTWPEPNVWNVEASVECEDGTHISVLMDGAHVAVERRGTRWFIRLLSAEE